MILRTTRCRLNRMIRVVHEIESYPLALELAEAVGGDNDRSRVDVPAMPYSAGILLRDLLMEHCYTDRETMRRGLSSSDLGALQDVTRATNEEARHPAMRDLGMAGHSVRIFHVWGMSLLPVDGVTMSRLRPVWHVDENYPSTKFTLWDTHRDGWLPPSRLDDESLHRAFVPLDCTA